MDIFSSLTKNELIVLYWKCKGLNHDGIKAKTGYSKDWVQLQMSTVYSKLGFDKSMHWTKRVEILEKEICPKLPKDFKDLDQLLQTKTPALEPKTQPKADPEMLALVLYDEKQIESVRNTSITPPQKEVIVIVEPTRGVKIFRRVLFAIVSILIILAVGYVAFRAGRGATPAPVVLVVTATDLPATETPVFTETPTSTNTSIPTLTFTPLPTETPRPTATAKSFFDEGEAFYLKDGIYMFLEKEFLSGGGACYFDSRDELGIGISIVVDNDDEFMVRTKSDYFKVEDDLGNTYKINNAGLGVYCDEPLGVNLESIMDTVNDEEMIKIVFPNTVPLEAKYIYITIDWISGMGPVIFRKTIY